MGDMPFSSYDIRATAEVHRELGPEYGDAVVETFLARIDKEIGARVEEQIARTSHSLPPHPVSPSAPDRRLLLKGIAIGSVIAGIAPSVAIIADYTTPVRLIAAIWVTIAVICTACAIRLLPPGSR